MFWFFARAGHGDQGGAAGQGEGVRDHGDEQQRLRGRGRFRRGHGRRGVRGRRRRERLQTAAVATVRRFVHRVQPGRCQRWWTPPRDPAATAPAATVPPDRGRRRPAPAARPARVPDGAQLDVQPQLHVHEPMLAGLQHGPPIADRHSAAAIATATGQYTVRSLFAVLWIMPNSFQKYYKTIINIRYEKIRTYCFFFFFFCGPSLRVDNFT